MTAPTTVAAHTPGPWTENYIEGAATIRRSIYRRDGSMFTDCASNYDPPTNGIHLCGVTDDELQPTTAAVYRVGADKARELFDMAREVAECGEDEGDFIVDLCQRDEITEDFRSNRQLWPRAIAAWNAAEAKARAAISAARGEG